MRIPTQLGAVLSGTATLAMLAGCSGGGAGTPVANQVSQQSIGGARMSSSIGHVLPQLTTSVLRPDVQKMLHVKNPNTPTSDYFTEDAAKAAGSVIFVSDAENNVVDIFSSKGKQTGTLTGFSEPQGLSSDKTAHLYVADTANSQIVVYAKPYKTSTKLSDPGQYPADVDVDSKGNIGVTNIISTSGGAGSVSFYKKGSKTPKTLSSSSVLEAFFGAFDAKGNFYFDGFNENDVATVFEVVGGVNGKSITVLSTANTLEFPGGVQVTPKGDIAVDDQEGPAIYTYAAPKSGKLGSPIDTTTLTGSSDPVSYAFTKTATDLYTADAGNAASYQFKYPAGGSPTQTISIPGSEPIGIAITPFENP
jgi:hypothetical protein